MTPQHKSSSVLTQVLKRILSLLIFGVWPHFHTSVGLIFAKDRIVRCNLRKKNCKFKCQFKLFGKMDPHTLRQLSSFILCPEKYSSRVTMELETCGSSLNPIRDPFQVIVIDKELLAELFTVMPHYLYMCISLL